MEGERVTGNQEEKAQAWIFWQIRYCTIYAVLPFHLCKRWPTGSLQTPTLNISSQIFSAILLSTFPGQRRRRHAAVGLLLVLNVGHVVVIEINVLIVHKKRERCHKLYSSHDPPTRGRDANTRQTKFAFSKRCVGHLLEKEARHAKIKQDVVQGTEREVDKRLKPLGEDLQADFQLCLLRLTCSLWSLASKNTRLINWTYITVTFLSFVSSPLSVSYDSLLFKGIFKLTICQITHCVASERLLARHVRVKRRKRRRKNKQKTSKG